MLHGLFHSPAIPPGLSMHKCGATGSASSHTACPVRSTIRQVSGLGRKSCPPWLPISAPPTVLDEWFFFISLVVRLPCSSIFCQFWLFFVFQMLLSFFWLCEEVQCVYLQLHLGYQMIHFCVLSVQYLIGNVVRVPLPFPMAHLPIINKIYS